MADRIAMGYTISPLADTDLEDIWIAIAQDNERAADKMIFKIFGAINKIAKMPYLGRARENLVPNIRSFAVTPYVIFYIPKRKTIEIVRVLHGARDIEAILN